MSKKVKMLKKEIKAAKEETEAKIEDLLSENPHGPFTHNLLSMYLRGLSGKTGCNRASNELIEEFSLDTLYGIGAVDD